MAGDEIHLLSSTLSHHACKEMGLKSCGAPNGI